MRYLLPILLLSSSMWAGHFEGKLKCFITAQNINDIGISHMVKMGPMDENIEKTAIGPIVVIDLKAASDAKRTNILKIITSDVFKGQVIFEVSFAYLDKVGPGNLENIIFSFEHWDKNFWGKNVRLARAKAQFSLPKKSDIIGLELYPAQGDLNMVEAKCAIDEGSD